MSNSENINLNHKTISKDIESSNPDNIDSFSDFADPAFYHGFVLALEKIKELKAPYYHQFKANTLSSEKDRHTLAVMDLIEKELLSLMLSN